MELSRQAALTLVLSVFCIGACSDSSGPGSRSVSSLRLEAGGNQEAFAGATLPQPIVVVPLDEDGKVITGQTASFTIVSGDGTLSGSTAKAGLDGSILAPDWTLGRSATPQAIEISVGQVKTTVNAFIKTGLKTDIRIFGEPLTAEQQTIFSDAVARLRAVIVGSLPEADLRGVTSAPCGLSELPAPGATTDGIVIYAGAKYLDGVDKLLGVAWTCNKRSAADSRAAIGIIILDMADINIRPAEMRAVALHEMLHVFGFGFWEERHLLSGFDTDSVAYHGAAGIAGCVAVGGATRCASGVPVQNVGGASRANSHWRDAVFGEELMTSSYKTKPILSVMTVRSLEDLGYIVNPLAADPYTLSAATIRSIDEASARTGWEGGETSPAIAKLRGATLR